MAARQPAPDTDLLDPTPHFQDPLNISQGNPSLKPEYIRAFELGLQRSTDRDVTGIAAKGLKEARYHVRHSAAWVLKLGSGTDESHDRAQRAVDDLWRYTGELFLSDDVDRAVAATGFGVDASTLADAWQSHVKDVMVRAELTLPDTPYMQRGGREGRHTEHLGHMLAEMQILARSHPGASW